MKQAPHLDNVSLVYHGIDTSELFTPDNRNRKWADARGLDGRQAISHRARMLPWKGVVCSVEAMATIHERSRTQCSS